MFELIENSLNERLCEKRKSDFFKIFFDRSIHKQVQMIRKL